MRTEMQWIWKIWKSAIAISIASLLIVMAIVSQPSQAAIAPLSDSYSLPAKEIGI
jgi:hypothetical protein